MPRRPAPLPPELGCLFTLAEARALGVCKARLQRSDIERPFHGVYRVRVDGPGTETEAEGLTPDERWWGAQFRDAQALSRVLPAGHFFSGITAVALWKLPRPYQRSEPMHRLMHVSCIRPHQPTRLQGVSCTTVAPGSVTLRQGSELTVTDPVSTWITAAPHLSTDDTVALGDAIIRLRRIGGTTRLEKPPLATITELRAAVALQRTGLARKLEPLLDLLSPHSASPPESHLRLRLREWHLPQPHLDHDVRAEDGSFLGTSEFAWPEFKTVAEYEGDHHRSEHRQWNRDIEKYRDYERAGWKVIRVTGELLYRQRRKLRGIFEEDLVSRNWGRG